MHLVIYPIIIAVRTREKETDTFTIAVAITLTIASRMSTIAVAIGPREGPCRRNRTNKRVTEHANMSQKQMDATGATCRQATRFPFR